MDGKETRFRCFSAMQEAAFPTVRHARWHNKETLKEAGSRAGMVELLLKPIRKKSPKRVRIHVGGDFFNAEYFNAWLDVAKAMPDVVFYAYTKSLPLWVNKLTDIPGNMVFTASRGGRHDHLIDRMKLKEAVVVFHPSEAEKLGLTIDHDDSNAYSHNKSFALLLHGVQKKGSEAGIAKQRLKDEGIDHSYGRKERKPVLTKTKTGFVVPVRGGGVVTFEEEQPPKVAKKAKQKELHGAR